jgi:hypothetical protein
LELDTTDASPGASKLSLAISTDGGGDYSNKPPGVPTGAWEANHARASEIREVRSKAQQAMQAPQARSASVGSSKTARATAREAVDARWVSTMSPRTATWRLRPGTAIGSGDATTLSYVTTASGFVGRVHGCDVQSHSIRFRLPPPASIGRPTPLHDYSSLVSSPRSSHVRADVGSTRRGPRVALGSHSLSSATRGSTVTSARPSKRDEVLARCDRVGPPPPGANVLRSSQRSIMSATRKLEYGART